MEFASGWNILNIAFMLSFPRNLCRILNNGPMSFYFPDAEILYQYTTRTDRVIARILFYFALSTCLFILALMILDKFCVVK